MTDYPASSRTRWLRLLLCGVLLAWFVAPIAAAAQSIQVVENSVAVDFANSVTFTLELAAGTRVSAVTLYYQKVGEGLTLRVPLDAATGQTKFRYVWELLPGDVPVGARMEYHWRLEDSSGGEQRLASVSFSYDDDRFGWKLERQDNVLLYWYGSNRSRAESLLGYATDALQQLQTEMGVTVDQDIHIYVYDSKSDMSEALPGKSDAFDDRILTLGVVVDDATLLILGSHSAVKQTMAHELAHVVVGLATDNPYAELPRWLDEGLAMVSEDALPSGNKGELEAAIRNNSLISVRSLSGYTGNPDEVDLFYGEVHSLVSFMLSNYGKDKVSQLLEAIRGGLYQEEALQQVYGFGLDELDLRWRASLNLAPRQTTGTPAAGVTPVPTRTSGSRALPCPISWLTGGLVLGAAVLKRRHAGAP